MKHIALFSQTGSEIADLITNGIYPDVILHDRKDISKVNDVTAKRCEDSIPKHLVKNVEYLRKRFGDPSECYITLHGWLNIVPPEICKEYQIYNGHPGYIIDYADLKGKDPQIKAFEREYPYIGSVIHHVTPEVDDGKILLSKKVRNNCKTEDEIFNKLKEVSLSLWTDFFTNKKYIK